MLKNENKLKRTSGKIIHEIVFDFMNDFDNTDVDQKEELFKLKLKIFEQDVVKNSKSIDKFKNARTDSSAVTPWRVATMGRLVEMGYVKWDIEKRTSKSLFQLQTTTKEKVKEHLVELEEKLEGTLEKLSTKERAEEAKKEIESLKNKVLKKLKTS